MKLLKLFEDQIVHAIRQADADPPGWCPLPTIRHQLATYYKWKAKYGGRGGRHPTSRGSGGSIVSYVWILPSRTKKRLPVRLRQPLAVVPPATYRANLEARSFPLKLSP